MLQPLVVGVKERAGGGGGLQCADVHTLECLCDEVKESGVCRLRWGVNPFTATVGGDDELEAPEIHKCARGP